MKKDKSLTIEKLIEKADNIQAKVDFCEKNKGHNYVVSGFSKIVHPETVYQIYPNCRDMDKIVFSSYLCTRCHNRVSVDEGREYVTKKIHSR